MYFAYVLHRGDDSEWHEWCVPFHVLNKKSSGNHTLAGYAFPGQIKVCKGLGLGKRGV